MNKLHIHASQIFLDGKPLRITHVYNMLVDSRAEIKRLNDIIERKDRDIKKLIEDNAVLHKEKMKLERDNGLIRRFDEGEKMP